MSLAYTTITGSFIGGDEQPLSGTVIFTASQAVYASGIPVITPDVPVAGRITDGVLLSESGGALQLLATDNAGLTFLTLSGFFYWTVQVTAGGVTEPAWSFGLPSSPSTVDLFALANMPFSGGGGGFANPMTTLGDLIDGGTGGTAQRLAGNATTTRKFLRSAGSGSAATAPAWDTLQAGDIPALPYDASGAAAAVQALAALRANNLSDLASASTARTSLGLGTAATAALASLLQAANNLSDLGSPSTARASLGLGSAATQASSAFDAAGAAAAVMSAITAEIGAASGIASLDGSGHVPALQLARALLAANNLSDLASPSTARTSLGLGGAAVISVPVSLANGGTGQATQQAALDALAGAVTTALFLRGNGTHVVLAAIQAADVPTLNQNTTGTAGNFTGGATVPAYVAPHVVTLTDASSTLIDASLGNVFDWPLGAGSHTLAAPSNPVNGQMIKIRIAYGGSFTPLFNAIYHFGTDGQPAWTATNAKVDWAAFEYDANISAWCCMGWKLGF